MRAFGLVAIAALGLSISGPAVASGLDFKLGNSTGYDIEAVHVGPAGSEQ